MNEEKTMRIKASANYALEQKIDMGDGVSHLTDNVPWLQFEGGFISPEKALEFAKKNKLQGVIRVVRVASPVFIGDVVNPDPVYTLVKVTSDTTKAPRKPRKSKVVTDQSITTANVTGEPEEALQDTEPVDQNDVIPLEEDDVIPLEDEDITDDLDASPIT